MSQSYTFIVEIPRATMEGLALNEEGAESIEGVHPRALAGLVERVVSDGLREHLEENASEEILVTPMSTSSFRVEIPRTALEDVALNMHNVDSIEGATFQDLADLLSQIIEAGLDESLGEVADFSVRPA